MVGDSESELARWEEKVWFMVRYTTRRTSDEGRQVPQSDKRHVESESQHWEADGGSLHAVGRLIPVRLLESEVQSVSTQ